MPARVGPTRARVRGLEDGGRTATHCPAPRAGLHDGELAGFGAEQRGRDVTYEKVGCEVGRAVLRPTQGVVAGTLVSTETLQPGGGLGGRALADCPHLHACRDVVEVASRHVRSSVSRAPTRSTAGRRTRSPWVASTSTTCTRPPTYGAHPPGSSHVSARGAPATTTVRSPGSRSCT